MSGARRGTVFNTTISTSVPNVDTSGVQSSSIYTSPVTESSPSTVSSSAGVGAYILQGLGAGSSQSDSTTASSPTASTSSSVGHSSADNVPSSNNSTATSASPSSKVNSTGTSALGTCTDISCASSCNVLWQSWESASKTYSVSQAAVSNITLTTTAEGSTYTYLSSSWSYPHVTDVYTLCDGVPRANATPVTEFWNSTRVFDSTVATVTTVANYTVSPPTCSINPYLCVELANSSLSTGEPVCDLPPGYQFIFTGDELGLTVDQEYDFCEFVGGPVQLLYWPVSTAGGLCGHNGTTLTTKGPSTVVYSGTTLTSPTVYISFSTLFAVGHGLQYWNTSYTTHLGKDLKNYIMPQRPQDVSSICLVNASIYEDNNENIVATSMNYADLQQPIRSSVYACAEEGNGNGTIWANFAPILAYPTNLNKIESAWAACSGGQGTADGWFGNFIFDPPIPLTAASSLDVPTITTTSAGKAPPTTPASPSTTAAPPTPLPTSGATSGIASNTAASKDSQTQASVADPTKSETSVASQSQDPEGPASNSADPPVVGSVSTPVAISESTSEKSQASPTSELTVAVDPTSAGPSDPPAETSKDPSQGQTVQGSGISSDSDTDPTSQSVVAAVPPVTTSGGNNIGSLIASILKGSVSTGSGETTTQYSDPAASTTGSIADTAQPSTKSGAVVVIGSHTYTAVASSGNAIINGQTVVAGSSAASVGNHLFSAAGTAVVVDGSTVAFSSLTLADALTAATTGPAEAPATTVVSIGSQLHTVISSDSAILVDGHTLSVDGGAVTISAVAVSAASSGLVIGSSVVQFNPPSETLQASYVSDQEPVVTAGSQTFTGQITVDSDGSTVVVLGTQSVTAGGSAATVNGAEVSAASDGIVIASSTIPYSHIPASSGTAMSSGIAEIFTIGTQTVTAITQASGEAVIGSVTLTVGGPALIIDGQAISQASVGLIVETPAAEHSTVSSVSGAAVIVFTVGTNTLTASSEADGNVGIGSQTLSPGAPAITTDGATISAGSSGIVVDGTQTVAFSAAATTATGSDTVTSPGGSGAASSTGPSAGHTGSSSGSSSGSGTKTSGATAQSFFMSGLTTQLFHLYVCHISPSFAIIMFHLRRAAARAFSSQSSAFVSKPRSLVTQTPTALRRRQQWPVLSFPRRFASDEASPTQAQTSGETVTTEPSQPEVEAKQEAAEYAEKKQDDAVESSETQSAPELPKTVEEAVETVKETAQAVASQAASGVRSAAASVLGESPSRPERGSSGARTPSTGMSGEPKPGKILYVGNLFFEAKPSELQQHFSRYGDVVNCRIVEDANGLSKGFGYVEFDTVESAAAALDALNQKIFLGRRMAVQYHVRREPRNPIRPSRGATSEPSKTLFIGNMSFQMSDKDLNDLFREIKNVVDVRVAIDRRSGQPRGFAHADFVDVASAEAAKEVLETKQIYGRLLKIDFSKSNPGRAPREDRE
ncbi:hypothetical protein MBLNU459_g7645t2 [Dothideomycetes sp. NU459]